MTRRIRTLLFSTLYPSEARPLHGIFVETRLRELLRCGASETRVVAPVPWFPSRNSRWGEYARMAATPDRELRHGIEVVHPRYLLIPKVGMSLAPLSMAIASWPAVRQIQANGFDFDVLDAHYYYPDGVAAALIAKWLKKPLTITARGTDLNLIPRHALPRRMIRWAAGRADASIGVCAALMRVLHDWGVDPSKLHVMRNGVDLERFQPRPQDQARLACGMKGEPVLLSVGHLIERKGHHIAIEALLDVRRTFPGARLYVVGEGPERPRLEHLSAQLGLGESVQLVGKVANERLADWYSAADLLILASSREGWANVLLESMACGTAVVATDIWGTPEVVATETVGTLVEERSASAFSRAIAERLTRKPQREAVREYAEGFSWAETSASQLRLFGQLASRAAALNHE